MITRTVTYKGQDIKLTYCLKVLFLFEQIMESFRERAGESDSCCGYRSR